MVIDVHLITMDDVISHPTLPLFGQCLFRVPGGDIEFKIMMSLKNNLNQLLTQTSITTSYQYSQSILHYIINQEKDSTIGQILRIFFQIKQKGTILYHKIFFLISNMESEAMCIVTFVWGIIIFQTTTYLTLYAPIFYEQNFGLFIIIMPCFITVISLLVISYYKSIYTPPGHPNYHINLHYNDELEELKQKTRNESQMKKEWRANRIKGRANIQQIKSLNSVSYCFKCDLVKESRVHHCRVCRKCIQRMDHHCPWTGNCVGKFNHKYFILFLFYATTGLLTVAISITIDWATGEVYAGQLGKGAYYTYYFACITSYMLSTSIGFLFVTQMLSSCQNITTLESFTEGITNNVQLIVFAEHFRYGVIFDKPKIGIWIRQLVSANQPLPTRMSPLKRNH